MPFLMLMIDLALASYCAVHALRNRQPMYWVFVLFGLPFIGSLLYFLVVLLPGSRLQHKAGKVAQEMARRSDPGRAVREAQAAFDYAPTAQNQMRLAQALLEQGDTEAAIRHYEQCLNGPYSDDLEIRLGAARANLQGGHAGAALAHLQFIRNKDPKFRSEECGLLLARAYSENGEALQAQAEFEATLARHGSFNCLGEFLIWALQRGNLALIERLQAEVEQASSQWSGYQRQMHAPLLARLQAAEDGYRAQRAASLA
ncbi:tetratricopeptide repeat protein [Massilia sp. W12]|uniref:tetratricopeptide repeat protein n=1 Tax=Massilia sp. W12 TaxID=3126507 RepID=UPI0030CB2891